MGTLNSSGDWQSRRVLVTGATGIVGSWLVKELLARDAYVVALIRDSDPQSELLRSGDIRRISVINGALEELWTLERAISLHDIDTVFHLGAQTLVGVAHRLPFSTFESNIRGSYNLLEACRLHARLVRRVVIASSDKAYGESPGLPYHEDMPLAGRHPYEVSKSCTDLLAQCYYQTYGLPVGIARCGNIYGGGDLNWSRLVPGTIRSLLTGARPVIRSDGTFLRDYIYVRDVVDGYLRLADSLEAAGVQGEAFNFSLESPSSVLEIVSRLQRLMDCTDVVPDIRNEAVGEIRDQYLAAGKARERLDWAPRYSLEDGLRETVAWYRALLD